MASAKGGSGKTVIAATFGALLSAMGKQVLLVDTDAATNGLTLFYLDEVVAHRDRLANKEQASLGTYELPASEQRATPVELAPGLSLVPATYEFLDSEQTDVTIYSEALRTAVRGWRNEFDFVFLDAQAGSDVFAHAAMKEDVSDKVVIVSEYDPLSAAGVERLKALFADDLSYQRVWVLLNKMLPDIAERYGEFLEVARYLPPIPWSADVVRAYSRRTLALDLERGNDHTVAVTQTLMATVNRPTADELRKWVSRKAVALRTPIMTQISDLQDEIAAVRAREFQLVRYRTAVELGLAASVVIASLFGVISVLVRPDASAISFPIVVIMVAGVLTAGLITMSNRRRAERGRLDSYKDTMESRLKNLEMLAEMTDEELVGRGTENVDPSHTRSG
jgi:cellulose biosynthesis protein BcsQ